MLTRKKRADAMRKKKKEKKRNGNERKGEERSGKRTKGLIKLLRQFSFLFPCSVIYFGKKEKKKEVIGNCHNLIMHEEEDYVVYGVLVRKITLDLPNDYASIRVRRRDPETDSVMVQLDEKSNYTLMGKRCTFCDHGVATLPAAETSAVDAVFGGAWHGMRLEKCRYYYVCSRSVV
jgi:hypothetical protein